MFEEVDRRQEDGDGLRPCSGICGIPYWIFYHDCQCSLSLIEAKCHCLVSDSNFLFLESLCSEHRQYIFPHHSNLQSVIRTCRADNHQGIYEYFRGYAQVNFPSSAQHHAYSRRHCRSSAQPPLPMHYAITIEMPVPRCRTLCLAAHCLHKIPTPINISADLLPSPYTRSIPTPSIPTLQRSFHFACLRILNPQLTTRSFLVIAISLTWPLPAVPLVNAAPVCILSVSPALEGKREDVKPSNFESQKLGQHSKSPGRFRCN